jgi:hypothetical protein
MSDSEIEAIVNRLFKRVRQRFNLGMREYLAALDALQGGFGIADRDELKLILQLLWCHSLAQQAQFELIWGEVADQPISNPASNEVQSRSDRSAKPPPGPLPQPPQRQPVPVPQEVTELQPSPAELEPLALQPPLTPTDIDDLPELQTYWPISRRSMAYAWRYLRRPRPDGPPDVLDIPLTVEQVAKAGFFLAPIYHRRVINHAHLLLLVDQGGSMTPFHRFSRDLVETAQVESNLARVDVYYFHNAPMTHLYRDPHLTQPIELQTVWSVCDPDTSVLIFSDAGAARGYQRIERVRMTTEFLVQLQQRTSLIGWLNPMPTDRWAGASAEMISYLVTMEQMDDDGFSNLIEVIRGQSLSSV